jgi:glucose-6-phosphate isomerase
MSFILKQKKPKQGSGNGVAIARVRGGKDDKMYLVLKTYKKNLNDLPKDFQKTIHPEDRKDLEDALHVGLPPERSELEELYYKTLAQFSKLKQKGFVLRSGGKLEPLVKDNQVEKIYVAGISGSGKSTYSSRYITNYLKKYRDNEFFIFSNVDSDECLDKLDPIRVDLQNLE